MRSIRYCTRCVMPETKPDILFDEEGVCSACRHYEQRSTVDWESRRAEFTEIVDKYKSRNSNHDCIVPVSGGKDSTTQTLRLLESGLTPLCVTASTDHLTEIGRRNIENIKSLGVDYIEVTPNPVVRRRINKLALTEVGDISWPEHVAIFTVPVRLSVQLDVPLIVWGENSQNEYGGPAAAAENNVLTRRWLEEFGGLLGLRVSDIVGRDGITKKDLILYTYPSDEQFAQVGVTGVFLGYYFPWDGWANALYAQAHGFETYPSTVEGSLVNYENLDNAQTGIHDYFKYLKYGFGRATDIACSHIRRGRLSRSDAIRLVTKHDGKFPSRYVGVELHEILASISMTESEFLTICDRFTNRSLFQRSSTGEYLRRADGSPVKTNYDNE